MFIELQDSLSSSENRDKARLEASNGLANLADFDDPNLDPEHAIAGLLEDDSPYPEVRSAVANTDDPSIPTSTLRAWIIGTTWAVLLSAFNQLFYFRYPSVSLPDFIVMFVSLLIGRAWASIVPNWRILGVSLNPGPFTIKEHVLLTIMATVNSGSAYVTDIIMVQQVFYHQTCSFSYQWMLVMSTQLIGFSIGGISRRFLVQPSSMIWPENLVSCTLYNMLHGNSYVGMGTRGGISRERMFLYICAASACWYFVPGYLFQALSTFSWVCWIFPDNIVVNQLFGYVSGLGMSLITFDWAQITYCSAPLVTPWWAEANIVAGFLFVFWFLTPILYYTNTWYSQYMPILGNISYDNTGAPYNVSKIINADLSFNLTAYEQYSPLFLPTTFAMCYGVSFALIGATLSHTILYFRKQIWARWRRPMHDHHDVHARLASRYKQVPEWWYAVIFVSMIVMCILVIEVWHTELPVWALFLSLAIVLIHAIPIGMVMAVTNQRININVITELIIGYLLPGRPLALLLFKSWGTSTMIEAIGFVEDMKIGHYMKIPPRSMFWAQIIPTIICGTIQIGVQSWMTSNIPDICSSKQKDGFTCPATKVLGTSSIIWGVIGPKRLFSPGQIYNTLLYGFLIGAACPVIAYMIHLKRPYSFIRYVHFPAMFNGLGSIPPATSLNYVPTAIVSFIFQYYIRKKHLSWWVKYNYILSSALGVGVSFSALIIFFALQLPKNGTIGLNTVQAWWGNTVYSNTADGNNLPYKSLPDGSTFGPSTW